MIFTKFLLLAKKIKPIQNAIVNSFSILYYYSNYRTWSNTFFLGTPVAKCPLDLWIYQEIIYDIKPDIIIECGTNRGGSALYFASICDLINNGEIITIDINDAERKPIHKRIHYLIGSSVSKETIDHVKELIKGKNKVMVVLDSDHHKEHVLKELRIYSEFVTRGSYLIVEDTNINAHPILADYGPGPMEALLEFLSENNAFVIDKLKEKFFLTFFPNGFLKRIK